MVSAPSVVVDNSAVNILNSRKTDWSTCAASVRFAALSGRLLSRGIVLFAIMSKGPKPHRLKKMLVDQVLTKRNSIELWRMRNTMSRFLANATTIMVDHPMPCYLAAHEARAGRNPLIGTSRHSCPRRIAAHGQNTWLGGYYRDSSDMAGRHGLRAERAAGRRRFIRGCRTSAHQTPASGTAARWKASRRRTSAH
jgi:hypothetical protein